MADDQHPIYFCDPCECGGTPGCPICDPPATPVGMHVLEYVPPPAYVALPTLGPRLVRLAGWACLVGGIVLLIRWAM
jgi:hypothetical protein